MKCINTLVTTVIIAMLLVPNNHYCTKTNCINEDCGCEKILINGETICKPNKNTRDHIFFPY